MIGTASGALFATSTNGAAKFGTLPIAQGGTGATTAAAAKSNIGLGNVVNINQSKAIKSITRSGTTFTATALDGTTTTFTQQDNNTTYSAATSSSAGLMSASDKAKLDGIASGANKYTHPGYTAHSSGLYKVTVDSTGHVSSVASVSKSDITALGIPGQDTNTTYSDATTSAHGLMSAEDKVSLDNAMPRSGGSFTGYVSSDHEISDRYGNMIVSREVSCKNVSALIENVRYTNGCCGSVSFSDAEFIAGVTINATWFNYIWVPHRTGAYNGKANNDNCDYGTLILTSMIDYSPSAIFRFTGGRIGQVRLLDSQWKSFTLSASGWSSGSYKISDSLITTFSNQEVLPAVGITAAQYNALSKAQIVDGGQAPGSLTLKALGTVPTIDIPIRVIFRGTI